jgi:hypothetical protein
VRIEKASRILIVEASVIAGQVVCLAKRKHRVHQVSSLFGSLAGTEKLADGVLERLDKAFFATKHKPIVKLIFSV